MGRISTYGRYMGYKVSLSDRDGDTYLAGHWSPPSKLDFARVDKYWSEKRLPAEAFECIWEQEGHEVVRVLAGELRVHAEAVEVEDERNQPYRRWGEFAVYRGVEYRADPSPSPHASYCRLISRNPQDQGLGFIATEPGLYEKEVPKEQMETAYRCSTYARYQGRVFAVNKVGENTIELTNSWYHPRMSKEEFEELGFTVAPGTLLSASKWVEIGDVETIWEQREPWGFPGEASTVTLK